MHVYILVISLTGFFAFMYDFDLDSISTLLKIACGLILVIAVALHLRQSKRKEEKLAETHKKIERWRHTR